MNRIGPHPNNTWGVSATSANLVRTTFPSLPIALAAEPKPISIDQSRTGMVVIDMQNDFCHPKGWLASIGVDITPARSPIQPLTTLLPALRAAGIPIIWVNWGARPDRLNLSPSHHHVYDPSGEGDGLGVTILQAGTWSAAIVDELTPPASDIRIDKHRMSGFWDTPLDSVCRNLRLDTLLFAGVNLDQCVLHTLADANFLGYDTILIQDCAATTNPDFCHQATILNIHQIFGFTVTSTALLEGLHT